MLPCCWRSASSPPPDRRSTSLCSVDTHEHPCDGNGSSRHLRNGAATASGDEDRHRGDGLSRQEFEGLVSRRDNRIGEGGFRFALFYLDFADGLVGNVENALEVYASVVGVDLSVPAPQAEPDAAVPPGDPEVVDADPVAAVPAPRAAPDEEPTPDVT